MLMFSFKNNKPLYYNYFKIYDVKGRKFKLAFLLLFVIFIISIISPAPMNYLQSIKEEMKLKSCDNLYDYIIPLSASFITIYVFYYDYKNKIYELITFYNRNNFNYIIFYRWIAYMLIFTTGSFVNGLIYYRRVGFLSISNLILSLRFIPNILFLCSLVLLLLTITKNVYASLFVLTSYYSIDLLSSGRIFKIVSIGASSNNFYYTISPAYFLVNRFILLLLSCIFIYISCKSSSKL